VNVHWYEETRAGDNADDRRSEEHHYLDLFPPQVCVCVCVYVCVWVCV
jgi:hypothetical protein